MEYFPCPHCGEDIPDDATFCRYCGSDAETGWAEDVDYQSIELPEEDDAPGGATPSRSTLRWKIGAGVLLLAGVMLLVPLGSPRLQFFRYVAYAFITLWFIYVLFGKRRL